MFLAEVVDVVRWRVQLAREKVVGGGRETRVQRSLKNGGFAAFLAASVVDRESRQSAVDRVIAYVVASW